MMKRDQPKPRPCMGVHISLDTSDHCLSILELTTRNVPVSLILVVLNVLLMVSCISHQYGLYGAYYEPIVLSSFTSSLVCSTGCIKKNGAHLLCLIISKLLKLIVQFCTCFKPRSFLFRTSRNSYFYSQ